MAQERSGRRPSSLVMRTVMLGEKRTTVRLERAMWEALEEISRRQDRSMNALLTHVFEQENWESSFAASLRSFVIRYYRGQ